jgi:hypothetical protein
VSDAIDLVSSDESAAIIVQLTWPLQALSFSALARERKEAGQFSSARASLTKPICA